MSAFVGIDWANGPDYSAIHYPRIPKVPGNAELRKIVADALRVHRRERALLIVSSRLRRSMWNCKTPHNEA